MGTFASGSSSTPTTPYEVDVGSITNTACTTNTLYNPGQITGNMICARESGKDACQGSKYLNFYICFIVISRRFWWYFDDQGEQLLLSDRSGVLGYWMWTEQCSGCLNQGYQPARMDQSADQGEHLP